MVKKPCFILFVSVFAILLAVSCSALPQQYYDNGVSDEEYIRIASEVEEAKAFLNQFPETQILVDRSGTLAVDFRFNKVLPSTTETAWAGIRLRVFIDPMSKRAGDAFIQCSDQSGQSIFVKEELIHFMKQYRQSLSCP